MTASKWKERAMAVVGSAVLAPSSHNTQPWIFRVAPSTIDLLADRDRALPVNDPEDRELTISCGAALLNLRAAAASQGFQVRVERLPDAGQPDWLARVSVVEGEAPAAEAALAGLMETRRTHRKAFTEREVGASAVSDLEEAARAEGAWLRPLVTETERQHAAALVAEGDAAQWAAPAWRRELADWLRPRRRGDGLAVPTLAAPIARAVVRTFDLGRRIGAADRRLAATAPLLAVLVTEHDEPRHWIRAGEALQRVLLMACRLDLQASYLNQPIQVPALRSKLEELVGDEAPQLLLRIGYPSAPAPRAPRRAVADVIQWVQ